MKRVLRAIRCHLFHQSAYEEREHWAEGAKQISRLTLRVCGICGRDLMP